MSGPHVAKRSAKTSKEKAPIFGAWLMSNNFDFRRRRRQFVCLFFPDLLLLPFGFCIPDLLEKCQGPIRFQIFSHIRFFFHPQEITTRRRKSQILFAFFSRSISAL